MGSPSRHLGVDTAADAAADAAAGAVYLVAAGAELTRPKYRRRVEAGQCTNVLDREPFR